MLKTKGRTTKMMKKGKKSKRKKRCEFEYVLMHSPMLLEEEKLYIITTVHASQPPAADNRNRVEDATAVVKKTTAVEHVKDQMMNTINVDHMEEYDGSAKARYQVKRMCRDEMSQVKHEMDLKVKSINQPEESLKEEVKTRLHSNRAMRVRYKMDLIKNKVKGVMNKEEERIEGDQIKYNELLKSIQINTKLNIENSLNSQNQSCWEDDTKEMEQKTGQNF